MEQGEVVLRRLAEAEPRIDDEVVPRDTEAQSPIEGTLQVGDDLGDHVAIARLVAVVHHT